MITNTLRLLCWNWWCPNFLGFYRYCLRLTIGRVLREPGFNGDCLCGVVLGRLSSCLLLCASAMPSLGNISLAVVVVCLCVAFAAASTVTTAGTSSFRSYGSPNQTVDQALFLVNNRGTPKLQCGPLRTSRAHHIIVRVWRVAAPRLQCSGCRGT
jgi:hypothetical protein